MSQPTAQDTLSFNLFPRNELDKEKLPAEILSFVLEIFGSLNGVVWAGDEFNLSLSQNDQQWFLSGQMYLGPDSGTEEEWFVVWLLREISRKWDIAAQ